MTKGGRALFRIRTAAGAAGLSEVLCEKIYIGFEVRAGFPR